MRIRSVSYMVDIAPKCNHSRYQCSVK